MTAQIPEKMTYEGISYDMISEPLYSVLFRKKNRHLRFMTRTTACRRGYVGLWEIVEDCLFLKSFSAKLRDGTPFGMADLFPDEPQPVFARWYTGVLTLPYGEELKYVHSGYESIHEFSLHLKVENGRILDKVVQKNEPPPRDELDDLDEGLY